VKSKIEAIELFIQNNLDKTNFPKKSIWILWCELLLSLWSI